MWSGEPAVWAKDAYAERPVVMHMLVTSASGAFAPERSVGFRRPRGLRFGPGGRLYCVGEDHVVAFDFRKGSFAGPVVHLARLNGQALVLVPS